MKILMILSRFPFPLEKGDKLRAFNQIKILSEKHKVFVFCITPQKPDDEAIKALSPYCEICWYQPSKLEILANIIRVACSRKPLQNAFFVFKKAKRKLQKNACAIQPDYVFCQGIRVADYAKQIKDVPKTLDYEDAFSLRMLRFAEQSKFPMNWIYKSAYRRLKDAEIADFDAFNYRMIISESDKKFINHPKRDEILVVKNGVDLDFFKSNPNVPKTADLLFVGNLTYPPNIQAMSTLLEDIMPKLIEKNPSVKLLIAGANPSKKWFKYQSPNVEIYPNPKDIREAYRTAKILVAPMMLGSGLQNKLLEAMAMKLPCITTSLANSGLQATPNTEILIAETPDEFVDRILFLQNNPEIYHQLSEHAFEFVRSFSWEKELEKWTHEISKTPVK